MPRPEDWLGRTVIIGTDMYGGDTMGTLDEVRERGVVVRHEIVEVESELIETECELAETESESEVKLQSVFDRWTKVNWMDHPEE